MQMKFFSIVVVSLNSGKRLNDTLHSILKQTYTNYEVIIKDGGSTDGSLDFLEEEELLDQYSQICLVREKDKSIYDGMNQALTYVTGRYVQFLNCGDLFYDENVLQNVADYIEADLNTTTPDKNSNGRAGFPVQAIYYGNQYNLLQKSVVTSVPQMNDFACYRNVPCHQVCFYDKRLFDNRAYLVQYTVRADYEHFLYCVYEEHAKTQAMPIVICLYEGGGYSETKENRKKSTTQHKEITSKYLGKKALKYRLIMLLTFSGLRTKIAESPVLSKPYNAVKSFIYKMK